VTKKIREDIGITALELAWKAQQLPVDQFDHWSWMVSCQAFTLPSRWHLRTPPPPLKKSIQIFNVQNDTDVALSI
jgi:hypothetical protein